MANEVRNLTHIPKHSLLHWVVQNSKQSEVARTQVKQIWWMINGHHVIAPHLVNEFLSVAAVRVVHVPGEFDQVFSPA
jgi:hypothetical protein